MEENAVSVIAQTQTLSRTSTLTGNYTTQQQIAYKQRILLTFSTVL